MIRLRLWRDRYTGGHIHHKGHLYRRTDGQRAIDGFTAEASIAGCGFAGYLIADVDHDGAMNTNRLNRQNRGGARTCHNHQKPAFVC